MLVVHLFVYLARVHLLFFFSSWCQGLAADYDYGTPWTFLLTFEPAHEIMILVT